MRPLHRSGRLSPLPHERAGNGSDADSYQFVSVIVLWRQAKPRMHGVRSECRWFTQSDEPDLLCLCGLPALISIANTAMLRVYQIRATSTVVSINPAKIAFGSTSGSH